LSNDDVISRRGDGSTVLSDKYTCKQEECTVCVSDNVLPVGCLDVG
jgi:hypothetical protein